VRSSILRREPLPIYLSQRLSMWCAVHAPSPHMSLSLSISKRFRALKQRSRASFHSLLQSSPRTRGEKQKVHAKAAFMSH